MLRKVIKTLDSDGGTSLVLVLSTAAVQLVLTSLVVNNMELSSYSSDTLSSISSILSSSSSASYDSIKTNTSLSSTLSKHLKFLDFRNEFKREGRNRRKSLKKIFKNLFVWKSKCEKISEDSCPPGLYCVIDEFLTEYDLRIIEEEERADIVARKGEQEKKKRQLLESV